ncbi:MAG TPA: DUF4476 domain-containing protein [Myxococcales bacterium]
MKPGTLLVVCGLFASPAWGQGVTVQTSHSSRRESRTESRTETTLQNDRYRLAFETNPNGLTVMKVVAPEGARCEVWDGPTLLREDDIPLSFVAEGDRAYRFKVKFADGRVWEEKLSPKLQQTTLLTVNVNVNVSVSVGGAAPAPAPRAEEPRPVRPTTGVQGMSDRDFTALRDAIENETLPQQKWAVLQTAVGSGARFWADQVGTLIDLFDSSAQKVSVVETTRTRIADRKNLFTLYSHFDSEADKQKVRAMFGQ